MMPKSADFRIEKGYLAHLWWVVRHNILVGANDYRPSVLHTGLYLTLEIVFINLTLR